MGWVGLWGKPGFFPHCIPLHFIAKASFKEGTQVIYQTFLGTYYVWDPCAWECKKEHSMAPVPMSLKGTRFFLGMPHLLIFWVPSTAALCPLCTLGPDVTEELGRLEWGLLLPLEM